jgi:hypothetical protein
MEADLPAMALAVKQLTREERLELVEFRGGASDDKNDKFLEGDADYARAAGHRGIKHYRAAPKIERRSGVGVRKLVPSWGENRRTSAVAWLRQAVDGVAAGVVVAPRSPPGATLITSISTWPLHVCFNMVIAGTDLSGLVDWGAPAHIHRRTPGSRPRLG